MSLTTDSGTWVLVNLRMLDASHNRLRYLGAGQSEDAGCLSQQTQVLGAGQPEDAGCLQRAESNFFEKMHFECKERPAKTNFMSAM